MSELVHGLDDLVGEWVARRIPAVGTSEGWRPFRAIGVAEGRRLIAGAVFHAYSGPDIQISFAAESARWATRSNIAGILDYPFSIGCSRVTALCERKNKRVRKLLEGIGFKMEGVARRGFGRQDAMIYGLLSEDRKFARNHGQKQQSASAA